MVAMSELMMHTEVGVHNQNMPQSMARIIEGGSWKKQRMVVVIPADKVIPSKVALSYWNLMFPPNQPVYKILAQGMEVGHAYSSALEMIMSHPDLSTFEYLLTIEADNMPPPDGVLKLLRRMETHPELSCISGLYWIKGEGGIPQIWGDPLDTVPNARPQVPKPGELVECCGTGMGFALWRLQMFRDPKLRRPFFKTVASPQEGVGTQDLYFWSDARKHGYRCAVDCDVLVGHHDQTSGITW